MTIAILCCLKEIWDEYIKLKRKWLINYIPEIVGEILKEAINKNLIIISSTSRRLLKKIKSDCKNSELRKIEELVDTILHEADKLKAEKDGMRF